MRRGQATVEAGLAALLAGLLVGAALLLGGAAWVAAERQVAAAAADGAARVGRDPAAAARMAVPPGLRDRVAAETAS